MTIGSSSMNSVNYMSQFKTQVQKELQKIATSKAVDSTDGASQQIFDELQSQVDSYAQGIKNANDGIGYLQIADGALQSLTEGADKINTLSVQLNSGILSQSDKDSIMSEATKVKETMGISIGGATYNGKNVFSGEASFYTGSGLNSFSLSTPNVDKIDVNSQDTVASFQKELSALKSTVGSSINSLVASIDNNMNVMLGLSSAKSQIGDTDIAQSVNSLNGSGIKLNFATMSLAHNNSYLASKVEALLR